MRVLAFDELNGSMIVAIPIAETDMAVMNRRTSSNSTGGSYGVYGMSAFDSHRVSRSIGTLAFTLNGIRRITFGGIADPQGVKNLFTSIKKETIKAKNKNVVLN